MRKNKKLDRNNICNKNKHVIILKNYILIKIVKKVKLKNDVELQRKIYELSWNQMLNIEWNY